MVFNMFVLLKTGMICSKYFFDIFCRVVMSFKEMYPEIIIEVFQGTYDDVSYWIKNGIVDFGFLSTSSAGDLKIEPFYRDPLLCIMPREYAQNREGDVITAEEMSRMHFVVQRKSTDADVSNYMKTNHLDIQTNYHVVDDLSTVVMVESGFGICLMPELTMNDIPYDVVRYRIDPEAYRMIGLAVLNPQFMAPAVRTLYRHIIDSYRNI